MNSIFDLLSAGNNTQVGQMPDINLPWLNQQPQAEPQSMGISNLAQRIQELLGAKQPAQGGMAGDILSSRFDTGYGDYATGVAQSAMGKPTLGPAVASSRISDQLKQINELSLAQKNMAIAKTGGNQGATMAIAQALMDQGIDPVTAISFAKSGIGAGNTMVNGNQVTPMTGAPDAAFTMANSKEAGQRSAELATAGRIGFVKHRGEAAGKASIDNNKATLDLNNLDYSIDQARALVPKVSLTGPVLGRVGNAANDPDYANLQGALNGITLQAKELYNLGSGQGFSDADRDFLGEVIAGKYSRAETIGLALDRMQNLSQQRKQFLAQQNTSYGNEFNYTTPSAINSSPASGRLIGTSGGKKVYALPNGSHVMEQ